MEILEKIGKTASKTYEYTAKKTGQIAKEATLRMRMSQNKAMIENLYEDIGKILYEIHLNPKDRTAEEKIVKACEEIDRLASKVESDRKQLLKLKDRKQCQHCFKEIEKDYKFCPECGSVQTGERPEAKKEEILEKLENSEIPKDKKQEAKKVSEKIKQEIQRELEQVDEENIEVEDE